jgi:hypothetical protein
MRLKFPHTQTTLTKIPATVNHGFSAVRLSMSVEPSACLEHCSRCFFRQTITHKSNHIFAEIFINFVSPGILCLAALACPNADHKQNEVLRPSRVDNAPTDRPMKKTHNE